MEVSIKTKSTILKSFAKCNNSKCGVSFLFDTREILGETGMLCPSCRKKLDTHHVVQCSNCQSIINFIEAEPSEEPVVYNTKKCSHCHGTAEDEREVVPYFFPDAFI